MIAVHWMRPTVFTVPPTKYGEWISCVVYGFSVVLCVLNDENGGCTIDSMNINIHDVYGLYCHVFASGGKINKLIN